MNYDFVLVPLNLHGNDWALLSSIFCMTNLQIQAKFSYQKLEK